MQKRKQAHLLHLGISLHLCSHLLIALSLRSLSVRTFPPFFYYLFSFFFFAERRSISYFDFSFLSPVNFHEFLSLSLLSCLSAHVGTLVLCLWCCGLDLGGHFLGPEGCFSSCLCKPGVPGNWKDEQLEGWRPVWASGGHRGHIY